ncbi:MAG TPA: hypothetical protein VGB61_10030, partial [Pyrinomonadaceae bacterium]
MPRSTSCLRRAARASVTSIAAATLIVVGAGTLRGASQSQSTRDARRVEMETRQRDLWNLERAKRKPSDRKRDERPAYQQVREDFEKLQLGSYNLTGAAGSAPALDYERIQEEAAEIRKRAGRLMSTLMLPEPEKGQKLKKGDEAHAPADLRANIAALDELVKSFVWNPIFQQSGIVDVE